MEVSVKSIVSQMQSGVIFTGESREGRIYRVRVKEALFPAIGETYAVEGQQRDFRDSYGRTYFQIDASGIKRTATSGRLLSGYLTTLTCVGEARAKRLIDAFGDQINEVLQQPCRLNDIGAVLQPDRPDLGRKLAAHVQAEFAVKIADDQVQIDEFRFYERLDALGVQDRGAARKLWRLLGASKTGEALVSNPYLAAALLPWNAADALGRSILRSQGVEEIVNHPERLRGAVDAVTRRLLAKGHTAALEAHWIGLAPRGVSGRKMLLEGLKCGSLTREGELIRPLGARYLEDGVSQMLTLVTKLPRRHSNSEIEKAVSTAEEQVGFHLTEEQRRVVSEILGQPLAVLQGGAGVGKTTVMSAVTLGWEALGGNFLMAALAGKAALQLSRATSRPGDPRLAVTIARLINGLRAVGEGKTSDELPVIDRNTLLIIDEASMVDTAAIHELLFEIVKLQPQGARLLFVGDAGQLPPVGFGAIFHHLVKSRFTRHLTKPLRQTEGSKIPAVAAAIRAGLPPEVQAYHRQTDGVQIFEPREEGLIMEMASI